METIQSVVSKFSLRSAKITLGASIAYLVVLALLHIIKPEVTPSWQTLSIYARGDWGWLGQVAYCLLGFTHLATLAMLKNQVKSRYGKVGLGFLAIAGVGGILGGLGVSDPLNTAQTAMTASGQLHAIGAGLEIWGVPIAALLVNLSLLRRNSNWKAAHKALAWTIALPLVGLVLFMGSGAAAGTSVGPGDVIGYMNRVAIIAYMIWQIVLSHVLIKKLGNG